MRFRFLILFLLASAAPAIADDEAQLIVDETPRLVLKGGATFAVYMEARGQALSECPPDGYWFATSGTFIRCRDKVAFDVKLTSGQIDTLPQVYTVIGDPDDKTDEPGPMVKQPDEDQ